MSTRRLFLFLFLIALYALAIRHTTDPDMWWHLRTGEAIAAGGIPRQDIFSFTAVHHPWVTHEWLAQLGLWRLFQAGGLTGLMLTFAAVTTATFGLIYAVTPGRPYLAGFVTLLAAVASAPLWGVRPQMLTLLFMALVISRADCPGCAKLAPKPAPGHGERAAAVWRHGRGRPHLHASHFPLRCRRHAYRRPPPFLRLNRLSAPARRSNRQRHTVPDARPASLQQPAPPRRLPGPVALGRRQSSNERSGHCRNLSGGGRRFSL
jgi:hypothetical protein